MPYKIVEKSIFHNKDKVVKRFKYMWQAKLYKYWYTFSWEPIVYLSFKVEIEDD